MRRLPLRSPPRMRGKDGVNDSAQAVTGITPACAGKSTTSHILNFTSQDHPRVCGEKHGQTAKSRLIQGSPPRVRGKGAEFERWKEELRITPACAGKSVGVMKFVHNGEDHPRVCGEKSSRPSP